MAASLYVHDVDVVIVIEDQLRYTCLRSLSKVLGVPLDHVHEAKSCDEVLSCFADAHRSVEYVMIRRRILAASSQECAERPMEFTGERPPPLDAIGATGTASATPFGRTLKMPVGFYELSERLHVASLQFF